MKWIGLTGGIASGKSTVTKLLRKRGFEVLDADEISHQVTEVHGSALPQIFQTFGQDIKNVDGSLDRAALAALVFGRVEELKKLEAIIHPLVREKVAAEKARLLGAGQSAVFYDVPLLYEKKMENDFDAVILVYCDEAQQKQRLMQRNSLSSAEADRRIQNQLPLAEKKLRTAFVVSNTGDLKFLEDELQRVLDRLKL